MIGDVRKNQRGLPFFFSSNFCSPKIRRKYPLIEGGAVPDNKNGKRHILCLIRGGCSEGKGAVPVDFYGILN